MDTQYATIVADLQRQLRELKRELRHAATMPVLMFLELRELQHDFESQILTFQRGGHAAARLLYPGDPEWADFAHNT